MKSATITHELIEAYAACPLKAYLLAGAAESGSPPHPYLQVTAAQRLENLRAYCERTKHAPRRASPGGTADLTVGHQMMLNVSLRSDGLEATCDAILRHDGPSTVGSYHYRPVKVIAGRASSRVDLLGLAYLGRVLGECQGRAPDAGVLIHAGGQARLVGLVTRGRSVEDAIETLKKWAPGAAEKGPPVILNRHCPTCVFRKECRSKAEAEDSLTLLDRMTGPLLRKYHAKGIFTVNQLSYLFRPRRSRKAQRRPVRHSLELQALAVRTGKTYIQHLPDLPRSAEELVVDLEGVPDRDAYYLIGALVCRPGDAKYVSFWADSREEEAMMWTAFVNLAAGLPAAAIYHYGSYERRAFATLAKRHGTGHELAKRLVNLSSLVFGRIYFPVRSNSLKEVGRYLGATWTDPESSGLQSLVWRSRWETSRETRHKDALLRYNQEDCVAAKLLLDRLDQIRLEIASNPTIELADRPKRHASEASHEVHTKFELILKSAEGDASQRGIRLRARAEDGAVTPKKRGAPKGHQAYQRILPQKVNRTVRVPPKRQCPRGHGSLSFADDIYADRTLTDLVFMRSGCRKTATRYRGKRGYCLQCGRYYDPPALIQLGSEAFGHGFKAWAAYQRIILRLPYRIITQVMEHLFGVGLSSATVINFIRSLAGFYAEVDAANLRALNASAFVHVDETKLNIQGVDHYVWVFTDGLHVVFRMTETREASIVHQVLAGYEGVLVSDFFPGYDAMPCRQQKCLVHLIGDLNDDLWKYPFDRELEAFALGVRALVVPILEEVEKYGLKKWHLRKYDRDVVRFYDNHVNAREHGSEVVTTYRKRFERYHESLFTFLYLDGIPWNNNMAERAIRQLAVQRKISGTFFKGTARHYLLLLAVAQTCRFQEKSFLKFLLSESKDVDSFRRTRPIKYSKAVGPGQDDE